MKKVLIALDYDPSSVKVAEKGYALGKTMGAKIILMHVLSEPVYYSSLEYSPIVGFNDSMNMETFRTDSIQGLKKAAQHFLDKTKHLSLIHISEPTRLRRISYAVFCLKKKKQK